MNSFSFWQKWLFAVRMVITIFGLLPALCFARVKRYRTDKSAAEADTIQTVMGILDRQRA